ncbi:MAG: hypothetical protein P8X47_01300 [Ignavibacteriaceae bacterium]
MILNSLRKLLFISIITLAFSCSSENSTNPPEQYFPDYYPGGIGSTFKYSVTEKDSVGNLVQSGTRDILFSGTYNFRGRDYTTQFDSLDFGSQSAVNNYLFRSTDTGVFYAVDTAQISLLIPDTLKQYVALRDEMQLLFYPLTSGSSWSLYRLTADVQPGISIKILDIVASFEKSEQLILIWPTGSLSVYTQKIKYTIEIYSDIGLPPTIYTAYMWYAENIGLVKFEGNQFIISTGGGGITFEPSSNILMQEIIEYYIR